MQVISTRSLCYPLYILSSGNHQGQSIKQQSFSPKLLGEKNKVLYFILSIIMIKSSHIILSDIPPNKKHKVNKNNGTWIKDECWSILNSLMSSRKVNSLFYFLADNILLTHTQNLLEFQPSAMKTSCGILIRPCPVPIRDSVQRNDAKNVPNKTWIFISVVHNAYEKC